MDIQEYLAIFRKEKKLFWAIVITITFFAWVWQVNQPRVYEASLLLNIGRTGAPATAEYTYDNFYRLQADERFADTVVRWLSQPRIVSDIIESAGIDNDNYSQKDLEKIFNAKRLSSQIVEVQFVARDPKLLEQYAEGIKEVTGKYTEALSAGETNWFRIVGSEPVIHDGRTPLWPFLGGAFMASIFVAFWGVLLKHFLTETEAKK